MPAVERIADLVVPVRYLSVPQARVPKLETLTPFAVAVGALMAAVMNREGQQKIP